MGILVRQEDAEWIVKLREVWYFDRKKHTAFMEFHKFMVEHGASHNVVLDKMMSTCFKVHIVDVEVACGSYEEMLETLKRALEFKRLHGDSAEWMSREAGRDL